MMTSLLIMTGVIVAGGVLYLVMRKPAEKQAERAEVVRRNIERNDKS